MPTSFFFVHTFPYRNHLPWVDLGSLLDGQSDRRKRGYIFNWQCQPCFNIFRHRKKGGGLITVRFIMLYFCLFHISSPIQLFYSFPLILISNFVSFLSSQYHLGFTLVFFNSFNSLASFFISLNLPFFFFFHHFFGFLLSLISLSLCNLQFSRSILFLKSKSSIILQENHRLRKTVKFMIST